MIVIEASTDKRFCSASVASDAARAGGGVEKKEARCFEIFSAVLAVEAVAACSGRVSADWLVLRAQCPGSGFKEAVRLLDVNPHR